MPEPKKEITEISVKYVFKDEEKRDLAAEMARKFTDGQQLEEEKKAVTSDFKSQIDRVNAEINNIATKLNNGHERRYTKCEVKRDYDKKLIFFIREDTGELVKTTPMNQDDLQLKVV